MELTSKDKRRKMAFTMAKNFIWNMKNEKIWVLRDAETKEIEEYLKMFAEHMMEYYDGVQNTLELNFDFEFGNDDDYDEDDEMPSCEKALRSEINKMLDNGRA